MAIRYSALGPKRPFEIKTCEGQAHSYKRHLHREASLGLIQGGESSLGVFERRIRIRERQAIYIPAYTPHDCVPSCLETWKYTMAYFSPGFQDGLTEALGASGLVVWNLDEPRYEEVSELFRAASHGASQEAREEAMEGLCAALGSCTDRRLIELPEDSGCARSVRRHIEERFLESLSLDSICGEFRLDRFALIAVFNRHYNISPIAYQICLKIDYAKRLLARSLSLSRVAAEAGFYDQAHFTREFKKAYGISPGRYRDMLSSPNFIQDKAD